MGSEESLPEDKGNKILILRSEGEVEVVRHREVSFFRGGTIVSYEWE